MKAKSKSFWVLLLTFVLGIIVGYISREIVLENQISKFRRLSKPGGLTKMITDEAKLEEEQIRELSPIIGKYDVKMREFRKEGHCKFKTLMDSLRVEIAPYLSEEQKASLDRFDKKKKDHSDKKKEK